MNDPGAAIPSSETETTDTRPTTVRWRILALLMASAGLFHFNRVSISAAGTEHIMHDYAISETQMGMVYSSYLFAYTLCMLPGGGVIDRIGPRKALMLVGFGSFLLVPLTGLTYFTMAGTMLVTLCAIRSLLGVVSAPFHPSAARMVSFWMPYQSRSMANGMVTGAAVIGIAATPFVFGYLMDVMFWPAAFLESACVTLALVSIWTIYSTDHPDEHRGVNEQERQLITRRRPAHSHVAPHQSEDVRHERSEPSIAQNDLFDMFCNRSLVLLTLSYAAYSYCQYLFFYWVQYYFDKILELGKDDGRLYATITLLAMAVGMMCGGWLADRMQSRFRGRLGRAITPICGLASSAILLLMGIAIKDPDPQWVVTCFALSMASLGACEASFWVTAIELGGRRGGLSGAFLNTVGNASGILAPVVTPYFSSYFGWRAGLGLASVFCLMGAALWWWIDPHKDLEPIDP